MPENGAPPGPPPEPPTEFSSGDSDVEMVEVFEGDEDDEREGGGGEFNRTGASTTSTTVTVTTTVTPASTAPPVVALVTAIVSGPREAPPGWPDNVTPSDDYRVHSGSDTDSDTDTSVDNSPDFSTLLAGPPRHTGIFQNEDDLWNPQPAANANLNADYNTGQLYDALLPQCVPMPPYDAAHEVPLEVSVEFGYAERRGPTPINRVHYALFNQTSTFDVVLPYYVDCDLLDDLNSANPTPMDGYAIKRTLPDNCSPVYEFVLRESIAAKLAECRCSITMKYHRECNWSTFQPEAPFRYASTIDSDMDSDEYLYSDTSGGEDDSGGGGGGGGDDPRYEVDADLSVIPEYCDANCPHPLMHYVCQVHHSTGARESMVQNFYTKQAAVTRFDFTSPPPSDGFGSPSSYVGDELDMNNRLSQLLNTPATGDVAP